MAQVLQQILQLQVYAPFFEALGLSIFNSLAFLVLGGSLVMVGLGKTSFGQVAVTLVKLSIVRFALQYYSEPMPVFGISFYHLLIDPATELANDLSKSLVGDVLGRLHTFYLGLETPGLSALALNTLEFFRYAVTVGMLLFAMAAVWFVVMIGYLALGFCVLFGPVMLPWVILPGMEWMAWGWIRSTIQYSFYPAGAQAYLLIMGSVLINFVDKANFPMTAGSLAQNFIGILLYLMAFGVGAFKVPSFINSMFSGRSGERMSFRF